MDDADSQWGVCGVTVDSTETEGVALDPVDSEDLPLVTDAPPPPRSDDFPPPSAPCTPPLSPADRALARLNGSASSERNTRTESPPADGCDLRYKRRRFKSDASCAKPPFFFIPLLQSQFSCSGDGQRGGELPHLPAFV